MTCTLARPPTLLASASPLPSRMHNSTPSPADIQSHIYAALLQGKTADVALRVRGTWSAIYKLHKLVLIQSGFFQSLFTAGFVESSLNRRSLKYGCDIVDIVFPDRNITRAAFEFCIARLYGGGPSLHVPASLTPTAAYPLTPSFPIPQEPEPTPSDHHPASPRFLLSLLATSIYLSIPSVATQALSLILSTVGPSTVLPYLNFALGKPLVPQNTSSAEPEAAIGLENIALPIEEEDVDSSSPLESSRSNEHDEISEILSELGIKGDRPRVSSAVSATSSNESIASDETNEDDDIVCHYGAVSNKIGEASACWLARWAVDILAYEASQRQAMPVLSRKWPMMADSSTAQSSSSPRNDIIVWGRGGLSAEWVAALVASDSLFVKNERHRYDFARSIVEMRRAEGVLPEEEREWTTMFGTGIYYSNMSMDDIITISNDISPSTKQPFVPLHVLQAAHWSQSVFRHKVTSLPPSVCSPLPSASPKDKELGITLSTAEIRSQVSGSDFPESLNPEAQKPYFPVPNDSSLRIGDNGTTFHGTVDGPPMSMDELFKFTDSPSVAASHSSNGRTVHKQSSTQASSLATSESTFFGLLSSRQTASSCIASDSSGKSRWSPYPPCRFSVEFWDYDALKEKSRLYSNTIWYAGSLFNVYIQIIRKKGQGQTQLGVYVHRQSSIDPIPQPSTYVSHPSPVDSRESNEMQVAVIKNGDRHHRSGSSQSLVPSSPLHYSPSIHPLAHATSTVFSSNSARASSPTISSGSPSSPNGFIASFGGSTTTRAPSQPYRDPRAMIAAYFMVSCASATGSSQTRFSSAPDVFSIGQSWGWKSSSLKSEEYVDIGGDDDGETVTFPPVVKKPRHYGKEVSFRATVVLGLV
ncbi:hypothetical protein P691DRAFT_799950 [Macrolepiota fuliginosa MF-IS2]|uniref:BTB domain-containing protein n=1 Tax=Macrolepiota fuliginosa MF-IS2 TaxID=1400762 RepID=A0A9P6CBA9_9AGAR|nr:hypothetical protein P691DRAFT_799950 [Macrolepiota fuliginosa MF-IS2]